MHFLPDLFLCCVLASFPGTRPPIQLPIDVQDVNGLWNDINEPFASIQLEDERIVFTFKQKLRRNEKYVIEIQGQSISLSSKPGGRVDAPLGHRIIFYIPNEVSIDFEPLPDDLKTSGFVVEKTYHKTTKEGLVIELHRAIALVVDASSGGKQLLVIRNDLDEARRVLSGRASDKGTIPPKTTTR